MGGVPVSLAVSLAVFLAVEGSAAIARDRLRPGGG